MSINLTDLNQKIVEIVKKHHLGITLSDICIEEINSELKKHCSYFTKKCVCDPCICPELNCDMSKCDMSKDDVSKCDV